MNLIKRNQCGNKMKGKEANLHIAQSYLQELHSKRFEVTINFESSDYLGADNLAQSLG